MASYVVPLEGPELGFSFDEKAAVEIPFETSIHPGAEDIDGSVMDY